MGPQERHLGIARATDYVGDTLVIQPDGLGGAGGLAGFGEESIQHACQAGFLYRPLDPKLNGDDVDPEASCGLDVTWEGGIAYSRPLHDPRVAAMCPHIDKGEAMVFGGGESVLATVRCKSDGSVALEAGGGKVTAGSRGGSTKPVAFADPVSQYFTALESLLSTMGAATTPPTTTAVDAFKLAMQPVKMLLATMKFEAE